MTSEKFHYKRGSNQQFSQISHVFDPSKFSEDELTYDLEKEVIPIAIHCIAEDGNEGKNKNKNNSIKPKCKAKNNFYNKFNFFLTTLNIY